MKVLIKILKFFGILILTLIVLVNVYILFSGKTYLYKGFANTYMKGRVTADIDEYRIFDNRVVKAGKGEPWAFSRNYNKQFIPQSFTNDFEKVQTIAYLVVKDDSVLHEQYWNGYSDTSHTSSFSMAKTFVGILTGIAIHEGKIKSLDEPISDFLDEFKEGDRKKVTLRHLLTMSSAIAFDESYVNPLGFAAEAYYGSDLRKLVLKYDVEGEPGKVFDYQSGNTQLLGFILNKATGMTLSEYASEKLWQPVHAEKDAFWSLDHQDGYEKAYCCFNSNARDFARIGQLYLDSGRWDSVQVVPIDFVRESQVPAPTLDDGGMNQRYGYAWWIIPDYNGHKIVYARGILGQYIIIIPDSKLVVVRLGKKRELTTVNGHPTDLYWYIDAALGLIGK